MSRHITHMFFRQLDADIKEGFLVRIGQVFGIERAEASRLYSLLLQCMNHRQSVRKNNIWECVCCDSTYGLLTATTSTCL